MSYEITDEQIAEIEKSWPVPATENEVRALISRLRAAERDAARFVFQHTNHEAMLKVEIAALKTAADIDWYRNAIDTAMKGEQQ